MAQECGLRSSACVLGPRLLTNGCSDGTCLRLLWEVSELAYEKGFELLDTMVYNMKVLTMIIYVNIVTRDM